ncbi:MAG: HAD-IIA family hydrolase [Lachnospiraceae bacterium]
MQDKRELMKNTNLFVLDMDGTFYLGDKIIDGALEFIEKVKKCDKEYLFFTNNSSRSPELYIEKLRKMNCTIDRNQIMTSADVTIKYIKTYFSDKSVYLVGTPALEQSFREAEINLTQKNPELVVVGFDTTLTYKKLELACGFIRKGAIFLATHMDINCPTEEGFIPDCGAMCQLITSSTGKNPRFLGKPSKETMDMVLRETGRKREEVAFVGDRIYTDVATGVKNGAKGILVLSGETQECDIEKSLVIPDGIFVSLKEMIDYL